MRDIDYRGFNDALLSLRGIAACAVLIFHGILVFKVGGLSFEPYDSRFLEFASDAGWSAQVEKCIVLLTNGHAAVTFFLVHSGFVLALSFSRVAWGHGITGPGVALVAYAVKRVLRLWPMIIASCVLAFIYHKIVPRVPSPAHSNWYVMFFNSPTGIEDLLRNIALQRFNLVPFLWSLLVETYGSILMPLFYLLGRRIFTTYLMLIGFYLLAWAIPTGTLYTVEGWVFSAVTPVFVFCFAIGTLSAFIRPDLPSRPSWLSQNALVLAAFIVLVAARWLISHIAAALIVEALASAVIVYSVYYHRDGPLQRFCHLPIVKFYGLISFSLYVNSLVCIHLAGQIVTRLAPEQFIQSHGLAMNLAVVIIAAAIVTPLSAFTFHFIEAPLMKLGRVAASRIERLAPNIATQRRLQSVSDSK